MKHLSSSLNLLSLFPPSFTWLTGTLFGRAMPSSDPLQINTKTEAQDKLENNLKGCLTK